MDANVIRRLNGFKTRIFSCLVIVYFPVGTTSDFCDELSADETLPPPIIGDGIGFGSACLILFFFGLFALLLAWMFNLIRSYIYNDRVGRIIF